MCAKHVVKKKFFYGWAIFLCCFLYLFVTQGLVNGTMSLYMVPVTEDLQITRTQFSSILSVRAVVGGAFCFLFGWSVKNLGFRKMTIIGFCCYIIGFVAFASAKSYAALLVNGVCVGIGVVYMGASMMTYLIQNWFYKSRGTVLGIMLAATGFGSSAFSPLVGSMISQYGWRHSYWVSLAIYAPVALLVLLLIREQPSDMGLEPYGGKPPVVAASTGEKAGLTVKQAIRMPVYYIMMLAVLLIGVVNNPIYNSVTAAVQDAGFGTEFAATVVSVLFFSVALSKIVFGFGADKIGLFRISLIAMIANILGIVVIVLADAQWYYLAFAVIFGLAICTETVLPPILMTEMLGERDRSYFVGISSAAMSLGSALGNPLFNSFFDKTGSYRTAFVLALVLAVVMAASLLWVESRKKLY